jgi:hypothetical protein
MEYSRWADRLTYQERICKHLDVQALFGKAENPLPTKGVIVIAPSGSNVPPVIETPYGKFAKNRCLSPIETKALAARFCDEYTVLVVGGHQDLQLASILDHPNCLFLSSEHLVDRHENIIPCTVPKMLALINGADSVYAVDSWVKTYSCYAQLPTTVIRTRYACFDAAGQQGPWSYCDQQIDISDNIFLNRSVWNLRERRLEELLAGAL